MRCVVSDPECVPGRLRKGMCEKHYRRALRTGSTELRPAIDNLARYEVSPSGCWVWQGPQWTNGYGQTSVKIHGTALAHRAFYIEHRGPIAAGIDLDHSCHNGDPDCVRGSECPHRLCVNPDHLDPVPRRTNLTRAIEAQNVCEKGLHDLTLPGATRPGTRQCVECWRIRYRKAGAKYRAGLRA